MATQPKIARLDEKDSDDIQIVIQKIEEYQQLIDNLNEQASEEILKVEQKYNQERQPHFEERNKIISKIPNFWLTTFVHHPQVCELVNPEDEQVLAHLYKVEVKEAEDIKSGFSIHFHFSENPWFSNKVLIKEFKLGESGEPSSTHTKIDWYPNKDYTNVIKKNGDQGKKRTLDDSVQDSIFCWFSECSSALGDELGELLKDDIWPNPLQYYLSQGVEEDNENDEDDDDEDEDDDDQDIDQEEEGFGDA